MKYLKKFESVDEAYHVITYDSWEVLIGQSLRFTESEFNKIKNFFSIDQQFDINLVDNDEYTFIEVNKFGTWGEINKLDDEWFLLYIHNDYHDCYKCDQLEGLFECLQEMVFNQ